MISGTAYQGCANTNKIKKVMSAAIQRMNSPIAILFTMSQIMVSPFVQQLEKLAHFIRRRIHAESPFT